MLTTLLYILFLLSAVVLVVVVLLQEGRGGGLTDALGSAGQATFGAGASGINRFTFAMIAVFVLSALGIHYTNRAVSGDSVVPSNSAPEIPGGVTPGGGTPNVPGG